MDLWIDCPAHAEKFLLWLMVHPESDLDCYENYQQMVRDRDLAFQTFCRHFEKQSLYVLVTLTFYLLFLLVSCGHFCIVQ